ncbi:MAG: hypothetical protein H0X45_07365 [Planctomycetes bacterium]|nr:hypothetical protein [Planctomycetota bacterium]
MTISSAFSAALLAGLAAIAGAAVQEAPPLTGPVLWFHTMQNLNNDEQWPEYSARLERAAKAGYTHVSIFDSRFIMQALQTPEYKAKVKRFRTRCDELGLKIAANTMPWGYGEEMMSNDVNISEGMPVRNAPFIVRDGRLVPHDPDISLVNGGLEQWSGDQATGWQVDDVGVVAFRDAEVKSEGEASLRFTDMVKGEHQRSRLIQRIAVQPFRNYRVSAMVRTQDCTNGDNRMMAHNRFPLNWNPLPIEPTMDWRRIDITFNSLEETDVGIYIGSWAGGSGTMWVDDVTIEPAGFVNVIRRESSPITITGADGTAYEEGRDYGRVEQGLNYRVEPWHQPPVVAIPAGSRLKEGQVVLASYEHALQNMTTNNMAICMSEPKAYELARDEIEFLAEHLDPQVYFLAHDEIRMCGWDHACSSRGLTPGQLLADNIAKCVAIVEQVDPGKPMVVWSDMFDPHHNAYGRDGGAHGAEPYFFLAKGEYPWLESWKGMPARLGVANWNNGNVDSVRFFAKQGHPQVLSHNDPATLATWLEQAGGEPGVVGAMYTTWDDRWDRLEAYAEVFKAWRDRAGAAPAR